MPVRVKRVYETASARDGTRVLVDRLWPRGLTKDAAKVKVWLKDVAPSNELRRWYHSNPEAWSIFRRRYLKELVIPKANAAVEKLYGLADRSSALTLLYASRNEDHNNATVLKELLEGTRKPPSSVGRGALRGGRVRKTKKQ
jgi:uncharacterized protein YeaO (DUF488 family)